MSYTGRPLFRSCSCDLGSGRLPLTTCCTMCSNCGVGSPGTALRRSCMTLGSAIRCGCVLRCLTRACCLRGSATHCLTSLGRKFRQIPAFPCFFPQLIRFCMSVGRLSSTVTMMSGTLAVIPSDSVCLITGDGVLFRRDGLRRYVGMDSGTVSIGRRLTSPCCGTNVYCFGVTIRRSGDSRASEGIHRRISTGCEGTLPCLMGCEGLRPSRRSG